MEIKHIHNLAGWATALMAAWLSPACTDDLDITPDGRITMEEVWSNAEYTEAYFSTAFNNIPYKMLWYFWFDNLPSALSDESWSCDDVEGTGAVNAYKGRGSASSNIFEDRYMDDFDYGYWTKYWSSIRILNVFLANIPTAAVTSEEQRTQLIAEARILRAFYYLQMVKWYGDLPLIDYPVSIDDTFAGCERQPAADILAFIVDDCQKALECPTLPWRLTSTADRERMTASIACAIMSQAALFRASKLYCGGENYWEWAYEVNLKAYNLLRENDFDLYTQQTNSNYNSAYGEYFAEGHSYPADKETIWGSMKLNHPIYWVWGMPIQTNYRAGDVPTQELVDAYDMLATGEPVLDREQPYLDEQHLQPNYNPNSGYSPSRPYVGRDLRFDATVIHNGSVIYVGDQRATVQTYAGGNCELRDNMRTYTRTGYYNNKFRHWYSCAAKSSEDGRWKFYRFGEVVLNLAEACIESGRVADGMKLVNDIRHRAGFSPDVDLVASGQDLARLMLRKERQVEFVYEEHRFFDVRRWTDNTEDLQNEKFCTGMKITKKGLSYTYERFLVGSNGSEPSKMSYRAKWHFLPIPLDEVSTLESKTGKSWQNYGW